MVEVISYTLKEEKTAEFIFANSTPRNIRFVRNLFLQIGKISGKCGIYYCESLKFRQIKKTRFQIYHTYFSTNYYKYYK